MLKNLIKLLVLGNALVIFAHSTPARAAVKQRVEAKLTCGPHSANPARMPDFQANMIFTLVGGQLEGKRPLRSNGGGTDTFKGTVSPDGALLISGFGRFKNGGAWTYTFSGARNDSGDTTVDGKLTNTAGSIGSRDCQIVFYKPRAL